MKIGDPRAFAECATPAPALSRGLGVLRMLGEEAHLSLEQLSSHLRLPKASVFRLLDTLERTGMILKTDRKHYEPLWILQPIEGDSAAFRRQIKSRIEPLSRRTNCSVEWYEPTEEGMKLILQRLPDSELCVKAKPGFLRDWGTEFEAVARLGQAFAPQAVPVERSTLHTRDGERERISAGRIRELTERARTETIAYDQAFNSNGVRRFAAAAFEEHTNSFRGVLALAEGYRFGDLPDPAFHLKHLKETLNG